jgi:multiple sugar transport system permease protein
MKHLPKHQHNRAALFFLAPWLLGLLVITLIPMVVSLYLSFTDFHMIRNGFEWVGVENYVDLASDRRLQASAAVTAKYVFISVPLQLGFALFLALLLNQGLRGLPIYRSIFYLPSLLGASVAVALLWRRVFGGQGLLNQVLALFGAEDLPSWIGDPKHALSTLIVLHVWTFGSPMIIFLAGLRQIPGELYESASVDGASLFQKFWRITIPLLTPVIFFNLILQIIGSFQAFTPAHVVSGGSGGPSDSTLFYTLYLYITGFGRFEMGKASAMAWLLLVVIAVLTGINFWASKKWVFYADK